MADLVVIVGVCAFCALCVAYVVGCDRIIGPDTAAGEPELDESDRMSLSDVPGAVR